MLAQVTEVHVVDLQEGIPMQSTPFGELVHVHVQMKFFSVATLHWLFIKTLAVMVQSIVSCVYLIQVCFIRIKFHQPIITLVLSVSFIIHIVMNLLCPL